MMTPMAGGAVSRMDSVRLLCQVLPPLAGVPDGSREVVSEGEGADG